MRKLLPKFIAVVFTCLFAILLFFPANAAESSVVVKSNSGKILASFPIDPSVASTGLQKAFDYVRDNGSESNIMSVVLPSGTYYINNSLNIYSNTTFDLSAGVTLKRSCRASMIRFGRGSGVYSGYTAFQNISIIGAKDNYAVLDCDQTELTCLRFAHASNVKIQYVEFTNIKKAHYVEFAGCRNVTFTDCRFLDFYPLQEEGSFNTEAIQMDVLLRGHFTNYDEYDGSVNHNITITNCHFENVNRGVGVHSGQVGIYMDNVKITNNTFKNVTGYAIVATNYTNSEITNNTITDCGSGIYFRHMTPSGDNYYAGNNDTVNTDMNCVIANNTISIKKSAFRFARYGIRIYGNLVTEPFTDSGTTFQPGDYRVGGLTVTNNTITCNTYAHGIWLQGVIDTTVSDNAITFALAKKESDSCDGIKLEKTDGIVLTKNTIVETSATRLSRSGIYARNAYNTTITNCTIQNMNQDGIYLDDSDGSVIQNNTILSVRKHGIYVDNKSGTSDEYISIQKNTIKNAGNRGICVNSGSFANVVSNTISKTGGHGICITHNAYAGNIKSNTIQSAGDIGIYINDGASAELIAENKITSPGGQGIYINSSSSVKTLQKNTIKSAKSYGIFVRSSSVTKIVSNKITQASRGINIKGSTVTTLQSNTISSTKSDGIYITGSAKVTTVKKNKVSASGKHGIYISDKATVKTLGSNTISSSEDHGIYAKSNATITAISKNTIVDTKNCGIRIISSTVTKITGNTIKKDKNKTAANEGIFLSGNTKKVSAISSNKLSNLKGHGIYLSDSVCVDKLEKNSIKKAGSHGIYIKNNATITSISGNTIDSPKNHGIYTKDKAAVKKITGNTIKNVPANGIYIKGTGARCTIKTNVIKKCGEIGIDVGSAAKVSISGNTISGCKRATIRLMGDPYKKISAENFKLTSVKKDGKAAVISWTKVKGVDKYIVYRSTTKDGTYKKIGTTQATTYTDTSVKKGKTYYYKVIPVVETKASTVQFAASLVKKLKIK